MAISSQSRTPVPQIKAIDPSTSNDTLVNASQMAHLPLTPQKSHETSPKVSSCTARTKTDGVNETADFEGTVATDNSLPSHDTLKNIEDFPLLDQDGRSIPFKSLYSGSNSPQRVLVIFIRHFFCGNCQEYIRSLNDSITPSDLLALNPPTSIAVIGCGTPSLISMYIEATSCPFPIFADPTKKLYAELGMQRTLNMGERPEYQRKHVLPMGWASFLQAMKVMRKGDALKGGDMQQVGGEFLFECKHAELGTPSPSVVNRKLEDGVQETDKVVTWCHRMRNTRDHAEIPELREVLGLDAAAGRHGRNEKRWSRALLMRKGTGLSRSSSSVSRKNGGAVVANENTAP